MAQPLYLASLLSFDITPVSVRMFDGDSAITADGRFLPRLTALEYLAATLDDAMAFLAAFAHGLRRARNPEYFVASRLLEDVVKDWDPCANVPEEAPCCRGGCNQCLGLSA